MHRFVLLLLIGVFLAAPVLAAEEGQGEDEASPAVTEATQELTETQEAIAAKQKEIAELNKQIGELQGRKATADEEAQIIDAQLQRIKQRLAKAELELKQTELSITAVEDEQLTTKEEIEELGQRIERKREQLRHLIRTLYQREQASLFSLWLDTGSLSEVIAERQAVQRIKNESVKLMQNLQEEEQSLVEHVVELEQQEKELGLLANILTTQQADLSGQRTEQAGFLEKKREEQLQYQHKLAEAEAARQEIEKGLFELKSAGVKLKLTEATDMARFASNLTGVRAALILAVLKVESNVGGSIGTGQFPDDMQPQSREPFLRVTAKLGLDPYTAPISARPRSGRGWGGAMGPAQIMPQTWEGIEPRLGQLMGKAQPNPYELIDAFAATAMFLADRGAADPAREYEAVSRYIAGPYWQNYGWYADRVLAVAAEYESQGL